MLKRFENQHNVFIVRQLHKGRMASGMDQSKALSSTESELNKALMLGNPKIYPEKGQKGMNCKAKNTKTTNCSIMRCQSVEIELPKKTEDKLARD